MTLDEIEAKSWDALEKAANNAKSAFRYLNLCSVDPNGAPQARMVVLRNTDRQNCVLEFHTDVRSRKWQEFLQNPNATVLGYCPETRTQLRLSGQVELFEPGTDRAELAWNSLPPSLDPHHISRRSPR